MGFLDGLFSDDPQKQAILMMGLGLLGGAPQGRKNFGADLSHAGLLGMNAYGSAQMAQAKLAEEKQQREIRAMQMEQMKRQNERQQQIQGLAPQYFGPVAPQPTRDDEGNAMPPVPMKQDFGGYAQALAGVDPMASLALQSQLSQMNDKGYEKLGPGDSLYDKRTQKIIASTPDKPPPGFVRDAQGNLSADPNWLEAQMKLRAAGKPAVDVRVNTEKTYAGNVAEGLAKQDVALIDAARSAPERIAAARRVREVLATTPITGTGATSRLGAEKALSSAGLIDGERVKNTENLAAELASATLDAIKTSGLGSGQGFTDKDRQFLEKARAGNIEINAQTLEYLANLNERAGVASLDRGNAVIRKLRGNKSMGDVGLSLDDVSAPPPPAPKPKAPQGMNIKDLVKYYTTPR